MTCPACQTDINDETAVACRCGYAFQGPQTNWVAVLVSLDRSARTIKTILVTWCWIALAAAVLFVAVKLIQSWGSETRLLPLEDYL